MHTLAVFATLAATAAAVQSNPHIIAKQSKPLIPALNKRSVEVKKSSHQYLTNTTERMFSQFQYFQYLVKLIYNV
jgi:carboxypeptidase D